MRHRFTAPLLAVLVLALAAFTGSAFAGDGHGNGGGGGNGNADKQSSTSASNPATGGSNAQGVKPSNSTKHDTYAKASSDQTKQYGNGKTAGQIATQAGYGDATLHGPGNSQPHKTAACSGGHEVDVHALKNKSAKCGTESHTSSHESKQVESKRIEVKKSEKVDVEKSKSSDVEVQKTEKQKTEEHKVEVQKAESHGVAASAHAHVTICHATGSSSNPYVRISPSASGVFHGHLRHQDGRDIVPPFTWNGTTYSENWDDNGQAIYNAGCNQPAQAQVQAAAPSQSTQSESVTVTVTSSSVSAPAATTTPAAGAVAPAAASAPAASAPGASAPATPAAAPAPAGGVKGAVVALKPTNTKPAAGGVLGATTRLGGTVASTRLPFTGLPLWIFATVALALIAIGLTVRRSTANRI